ncbi:MAG TPA: DUF2905 domain-containing protein [Ginsengibacter sp.]|nr:DUF2905 domain-containing protein [Chitinophagaceae bacterium]MCZ2395987.1 DUF2905 domain-containing protein [Chitinophagales bacterium]HRN72145.1 DUF2905 domain-containing protein [Ginsengibacter sp.]MCW5914007.1 DUF2905 domain-containing protein [Chitinophagaceae bacterium]HRP18509.1 DUF2905 domain-containing protein [Ginsengibacter sp.]
MNQQTGKYIIIAGLIIVLIGVIIFFFHNSLRWMGRLPGDIRIENKNSRFYFPIVTMIIVSVVLTLLVNLLRKWF